MRRVTAALCSGVPPATASNALRASPTSSGATSEERISGPSTSTTVVVADVLISSSPSVLDTTSALAAPKRASAPAIVGRKAGSDTPITCRVAPAGLVSGPRKLKIVRTASSLRTGTTKRVALWCAGANMKPKPTSRMHCATASGPRSIRTPSASSRSAEPDSPVAERLPCLATAQPAPAAISAAVVETLNVGRPPPVPAVSIRSSRSQATGVASSRMVVARPTSSSIVSPFVRSAISTAAVWASEALPAMISASTSAVCSDDRSRRAASASIAWVSTSLGKERLQQALAVGREHRLGVELDALGGQLAVAHRHQHTAAPRGRLELAGQLGVDHQRVVAPDGQRVRQALEQPGAVVLDLGRLAVDGDVAHDLAAERLGERLVAEADPQRRHPGLGEAPHRLDRDARLVGCARARRDDHAVPLALEQLADGRRVVAHGLDLRPQLTQVLDEVVGEGVVVVDHEDARHGHSRCLAASSIARTTPRALARDSSYSYSGLASATVPPPAWTWAVPSLTTTVRMQMQVSSSPP